MARILAVDDSDQSLLTIQLYLRGSEFELTTASSGREALALAARERFDLVLLDVVMPEIDGFEICRRLKADPRTAFLPVIFLTAHRRKESERLMAYEVGAVDYIQKPVHKDELVARIRVMLRFEETRGRLERDNARAVTELEDARRALKDMEAQLEDLLAVQARHEDPGSWGFVLLDEQDHVLSADEGARRLLGGLSIGSELSACGPRPTALAKALETGGVSFEVEGPDDDQILGVRCHEMDGQGTRALMLQDASGLGRIRRSLAARATARALVGAAPRETDEGRYSVSGFVGSSRGVREVSRMVERLRHGRSTVLIYGESGTGKELVARGLHFDGPNRDRPFIPIHCGAISPELIESELFGYEKGAFTGAQTSREGLFSVADGGTIFLDEIAETSTDLQVKLLRVLQMGEIRPVGANHPRNVDVRIIAATNRNLPAMVHSGEFREDLYYRLEVVTLHVPALRDRPEDIQDLIEHFLLKFNRRYGRRKCPVATVSRGVLRCLQAYPWPGNVRELENVIDRAFALGVGEVLQEEDLPAHVRRGKPRLGHAVRRHPTALTAASGEVLDLSSARAQVERQAIQDALESCGGDKVLAASRLGMSRSTFYRRLRELEI